MEWLNSLAYASAILFGIFGLVLSILAWELDRWPKRLCVAILSSTVAKATLEVLTMGVVSSSQPLFRALFFADTLLAPLPSLLVFAYFLDCCGENYRNSTVMRVQWALGAAMAAAGIAGQLNGEFYTAMGFEVRVGFWIILSVLLSLLLSAVCFVALIRRWKKLKAVQRIMFLACFLTSAWIKIVLVELYLMASLIRRYQEQKEETVRQRTQVAILQMRPHFIYNSLMSIYYLCAQDPQRAQQVILDFSRYLQGSFTAIARGEHDPLFGGIGAYPGLSGCGTGTFSRPAVCGVRHADYVFPYPAPDAAADCGKRRETRRGPGSGAAACVRHHGEHGQGRSNHR
jgi:hypothetical protein